MSASTESQAGFLSRRRFFGWASSLAAALGADGAGFLRQDFFLADGVIRW